MRFVLILLLAASGVQAQTQPSEVNPSLVNVETTLASNAKPGALTESLTELQTPVVEATDKNNLKTSQLTENQIPVHLDAGKKGATQESPWFKLIAGLLTFSAVAFGAIYFIRRYSRNAGEMKNAPQIKVLTQHYLGPKKHLAIVRVAGESILIGVTDTNISMLKSLSLLDEDIPETTPTHFAGVFEGTEKRTAQFNIGKTGTASAANEEDFSISGIKDFVSNRLKTMRDLE